ncbi:type VI secretion system-associated FHA domain protein TagH [Arcobacter sp. F2176]|uniref:type VI secretion system-associated FHA domain protein TagH n=1 Tax=Arcobacter sp. F2176 TaxID=2044511 RepID=UPI00100B63A0|nr:type VI secretion system-associated FHA domain protein TagH [Arcobacter sp. F2176]RXJ82688.1 type VI secretion system-associated FHA domain protein TagH [Arcobacter sp. F2176]
MKLTFDIIKSGRDIPSRNNYHFDKDDVIIGRSSESDWQLPDRQNYISSKHIIIKYIDGSYFIQDESTNGTYLKEPYRKLPRNKQIKINPNDIFIVGEYEIQARFIDNDYSKKDILQSNYNNSSSSKSMGTIIPDDFEIIEDMNSSFVKEDSKIEINDSLFNIFDQENKHNSEVIYDFEKEEVLFTIDEEDSVTRNPMQEHIIVPSFNKKEEQKENKIVEDTIQDHKKNNNIMKEDKSLKFLEEKLGIKLSSLSDIEQKRILNEIANIVTFSLDGLKNSLKLVDKVKNDLNIEDSFSHQNSNNPVLLGQFALNTDNKISLSDAVKKSFKQLDNHNIALHMSSKNLVNITLNKFNPKSLEHHFNKQGEINSILPKKPQLWDSYERMFDKLTNNSTLGIDLISEDFSKEYNKIVYTIKLTSI